MNCIIPGNNIKVVHKALLSLSKLSNEVYIECKPDCLQFVAINMSTTTYAKFSFLSVFFITYIVDDPQTQSTNMSDTWLTCKVYTKAMQNIFKQKMDKNVDHCKMIINKEGTKLDFELKYRTNVKISHKIRLLDFEHLTVDYSIENVSNNLLAPGLFFSQVLSNFTSGELNLSCEVEKEKITYRNYADVDSVYRGMRSAVVLNANEFTTYRIREESNILMPFKAFKNIVNFAEHFNLSLDIYFNSEAGQVIARTKSPTFEVDFVMSSNFHNDVSQTTEATKKSKTQNNMNLTGEDRQVLENMDWENDFSESEKESGVFRKVVNKIQTNLESDEVITASPEPPNMFAVVFGRCFEPTFNETNFNSGNVLAEDSDPD